MGSETDFSNIKIENTENDEFLSATKYFYSAEMPTKEGNFWRYVNNVPTKWE
jgi:hypothetical protein